MREGEKGKIGLTEGVEMGGRGRNMGGREEGRKGGREEGRKGRREEGRKGGRV